MPGDPTGGRLRLKAFCPAGKPRGTHAYSGLRLRAPPRSVSGNQKKPNVDVNRSDSHALHAGVSPYSLQETTTMITGKSLVSLAVAAAFTTSIGLAAPEPGSSAGARGRPIPRIFAHIDTNADGAISVEEFIAARTQRTEKRFDRLDSDADGLISLEEFVSSRRSPPDGFDVDAFRACMEAQLGIEIDDPAATPEERFTAADSNADGFLDADELIAAMTDQSINRFNKIDANQDGSIVLDEFAGAFQNRRAFRQARRFCFEQQQAVIDLIGG